MNKIDGIFALPQALQVAVAMNWPWEVYPFIAMLISFNADVYWLSLHCKATKKQQSNATPAMLLFIP